MARNVLSVLFLLAALTTVAAAVEHRSKTQTFSVNVPPKAAFSQIETQDGLQIDVDSTVDMWLQIDEVAAVAGHFRQLPAPNRQTSNTIILCKKPETMHIRANGESPDTLMMLTFVPLN